MNGSTKRRAGLIEDLVADLEPTPRPGKYLFKSLAWLSGAYVASIVFMSIRGPFRSGFTEQLLAHPQFSIESMLGVIAILAVTLATFRSAIPNTVSNNRLAVIPISLILLWASFYVYGLYEPALPASMAGKREHCYVEVFMYGVPALFFGLIALRTLYPLRGAFSGALLGLAAGTIPALLMQFACMYLTPHILTHHLLPGFGMTVVGAICGFFLLRPR